MNENLQVCPWCGGELEEGTFRSRGGNYFLPLHEKTPKLYTSASMKKRNAIPLPPAFADVSSTSYPTAYVCHLCKKIVISF